MKKILVIRFSSIGDIVLTTPVIRCLKEQTGAEIHFVTKTQYADLFKTNPHVDKIHHFEKEITEILDELKAENYDHLIDLHRNFRSIRLRKAIGTKSNTFPKLNKEKFLLTNFKWNFLPDVHIVDRYFKAVKNLGIQNDKNGLDHYIPDEEKIDLTDFNIPDHFIAFSIGAQYATKRLPNEKIIDIIQKLNHTVVLLGGPSDSENAGKIAAQCDNCMNLVGQLSVHQSASVVDQSQLVITHDTGLMHIAAALKKPTVSVWGNTVPEFGMYPYFPNNPEMYSIHEVELKCRPCSKIGYQSCPKKHFKCMQEQDVDGVLQSAQKLLKINP